MDKNKQVEEEDLMVKKESLTKLDNFNAVDEVIEFAKYAIDSGLIPRSFKKAEAVFAVVQQGRELNLGAFTALNNIHSIQGKPTLSSHMQRALARRNGTYWQVVNDFKIIPEEKDETGNIIQKKDVLTTIRFFTKAVELDDRIIEQDIDYYWSDAMRAGWTSKDNWKKYPKNMMLARCFSKGIMIVDPESQMGFYETTEIADAMGVNDYAVDENGNVINI